MDEMGLRVVDILKVTHPSGIDLLTERAPLTKEKVSLKLHQLEYKLDVEKKDLGWFQSDGSASSWEQDLGRHTATDGREC